MRTMMLALSAGLLACPVLAQTESTTAEETAGAEQTAMPGTAAAAKIGCHGETAAAAETGEAVSAVNPGSQEELRSALSDAGFEDVQVLRTGYVMEATAPNNECILIIVDTGPQSMGLAGSTAATGLDESAEASTGTAGEQADAGTSSEEPATAEATGAEVDANAGGTAIGGAGGTAEGMAAEGEPAASQASMGAEATAEFGGSSQQIKGDLIDSGYTGVTVLGSAYVVVARAPDGHLVAMTVRSDEPAR